MYLKARLVVFVCAVAFAVPSAAARQAASHPNAGAEPAVVECHVLEAHASTAPAALVVIFHQQEKKDQPRLSALIKANSGSDADIQIGGAAWTKTRVFRLRTCFGRGMMILSPGQAALKDGDTFRIRFSKAASK
jgi:hypothetical protein